MASRRKRATRRTDRSGGGFPLIWFAAGLMLGVGLTLFAVQRGMVPFNTDRDALPDRQAGAGPALLPESEDAGSDRSGNQYDFFTVLPEMEVVVPEQELSTRAQPDATQASPAAGGERFILQAGSFRRAEDADQMKAQLALLGAVANVQKVTVDQQTWHRVRVGPLDSAREADQLRRRLQENGIEVLVLRESS
jgi:hypothetical protein